MPCYPDICSVSIGALFATIGAKRRRHSANFGISLKKRGCLMAAALIKQVAIYNKHQQ